MKITIKTTQQKVFQFDVEGTETIAELKAKIQETQGHLATAQKIIYSGKILSDDKTIESCGIKEKDFLVLMVSKPKPTPAASTSAAAAPAPALAPATAPPTAPVPAIPASAPAAEAPAAPAQAEAPASDAPDANPPAFGDPSAFLSGSNLQSAVANMVEMGFPRDQVLRAMRLSFNNADRAVDYLMNGIPSHLEDEERSSAPEPAAPAAAPASQAPPQAQQPQDAGQPQNLFQLAHQQQQQPGAGGGGGHGGGAGGFPPGFNLEALRNNPQIQQIRQQMMARPDLAQGLIQQLAQTSPAISQMIAQNPEALAQLLGFSEEDQQLPPGAHVVNVTPEERAAIERLEGLGFGRQAVLEAYFACDKNEELAANYLFENGMDED